MSCDEARRLLEDRQRTKNWKRWGPYLSERQWGTVREDYSSGGNCWEYFPHDHARSRAYRWGEDGLLGIADRQARLCFALAIWNGQDPILKERLFGLNGNEGNHGEDVKELYFYLDSTPTHSYMRALYKYPQSPFPYDRLLEENRKRGRDKREFELLDTGLFKDNRYFDVCCEYAKNAPNDILIRIQITNRSSRSALFHLLPTLWFRNTWSWQCRHEGCSVRPQIQRHSAFFSAKHPTLGAFRFCWKRQPKEILLTQNETNVHRLFGQTNPSEFVKDAFHHHLIEGSIPRLTEVRSGTKGAPYYRFWLKGGEIKIFSLRLTMESEASADPFGNEFEQIFQKRIEEADAFYESLKAQAHDREDCNIIRQAYAGLLWTKQFYHYVVRHWREGDPASPPPPASRLKARNCQWNHFYARDILSMPDKWEYPWFAAWDLAFHMIPFARIDPDFAKSQMLLMLREWYLHPNGQLPAYEFAFGDVNPPVHAWAVWRLYKISGKRDRRFLETAFQKLLLNFTWWVNRKDKNGNNLFGGGFLGLDNIGPLDRSQPFPEGTITQADGTAWMAFYCLTMLAIAIELAQNGETINSAYEDMASKFFEHFVQISEAFNHLNGTGLWHEADGFYYDQISRDDKNVKPIIVQTRSLVGLLPLIAVEIIGPKVLKRLPGFRKRFDWFAQHQSELASHLVRDSRNGQTLLMLSTPERLVQILRYLCDENEFLSPFGIRSLSKYHAAHPSRLRLGGQTFEVKYTSGESDTSLFGGNSNWRGPIWFPVNYLLIEALERYQHFYGNALKIAVPSLGGKMTCAQIATEIQKRLIRIFRFDANGKRPCHGKHPQYEKDGQWSELLLFHEYFDGDTAEGLGATHQTGWTALIIRLLEDSTKRNDI